MTGRLLTLLIAFAYRRARAMGGLLWWAVIALAFLARYLDRREPFRWRRRWRVREGRNIHIDLGPRSSR